MDTYLESGDPTSGATGTGGQNIYTVLQILGFLKGVLVAIFIDGSDGNYKLILATHHSQSHQEIVIANGYGNFEYAVPSGYYALNTSNLNTYG